MDLAVEIAGIPLNNPVIAASGTFGYGEEFERFGELRRIGGISVKGTSARPIDGNLPPRLYPTPAGMLNSIGLENVGVDLGIRRDAFQNFAEELFVTRYPGTDQNAFTAAPVFGN